MTPSLSTPEHFGLCLEAACEAALAGAEILESWRARFQVREKGRSDLVTEADMASQQRIREILQGHFPDHDFLGEEDRLEKRPAMDAPPTWIVDPLDGTTNYVHDCPLYCVSIGLQVAGELVVGVVFDPSRREMFKASKGQGAWLGERRLQTSGVTRLEEALLGTGFPANMEGKDHLLTWWRQLGLKAQALRRTGSTALNMAYVAAGRFDGYWGFDNHAWDVVGGAVLIQEAGGTLSRMDGSAFDPFCPETLASNGRLHQAFLECFASELSQKF